MPLENLLQLNIAALVAMGSLLLGMGQNNHLLPMFAVGSAVVSVFLTDFWRIIRLNTIVAYIAGILAVVFCLSDFFKDFSKFSLFLLTLKIQSISFDLFFNFFFKNSYS